MKIFALNLLRIFQSLCMFDILCYPGDGPCLGFRKLGQPSYEWMSYTEVYLILQHF